MAETRDGPPTLYEWAGGEEAFERLINAFYDRVEGDELLSPLFPGGVRAEHRRNVTAWWCEVFGGSPHYTEELGGYERMMGKHRGLAITPAISAATPAITSAARGSTCSESHPASGAPIGVEPRKTIE